MKEKRLQVQTLRFLSCMGTCPGLQKGEGNFLQQMSQLAAAATNAASAAKHALTAMRAVSASSSSGSVAGAVQSALTTTSKVLRGRGGSRTWSQCRSGSSGCGQN